MAMSITDLLELRDMGRDKDACIAPRQRKLMAAVHSSCYPIIMIDGNGFSAYHEAKVDTRKRNLIGYAIFFLAILMLIIVDVATSAGGGVGPYIGICACVAAFGVADAHVQSGMVGDLSLMRPEFIQSFFADLAASGALTSGLRLMTKAAFEKSHGGLRKGTMLFAILVED
ncbi:hypothetical protein ACFX2I_009480 [Malus domestica]